MARGPRKTVNDQIAEVDAQIQKAQKKVDDLKAKREELEGKKRQEALGQLYDLIQDSGKSLDEVKQFLVTD